ncbi:MAG: orotate phosphoribosyltransferase [Bacillota bacterium]|nr:orotate phosphoribosyltransferase [Bacillota bacterium]
MNAGAVIDLFRETGVLIEGHFKLTSGRHSPMFLQCSQVMQHPRQAARLAGALAETLAPLGADAVIGPAMGGIILAYEVGRVLGVRAIFAERQDGTMTLRRGFRIEPGERFVVVEDAVSTGGSVREVMNVVTERGGEVVGVGMLVDRSGGKTDFGVPAHSLLSLTVPSYAPPECPLCREGVPLTLPKSGSG